MQAVNWGQAGIGALPTSPYDVYVGVMQAAHVSGQLADDLGGRWALSDGYHKLHACCQYSHSAVDAAIELHGSILGRADAIDRVVVETHPLGMTLDNRTPATTLAAKFSMPHIVATALLYGHAGATAFSGKDLSNSPVAHLRNRVQLALYPDIPGWPADRPARITLHLRDGETVSATCLSARGGPDRPFDEQTILDKVTGIVHAPYPALPKLCLDLIELDAGLLATPWRTLIAHFAAT
jgi:2-methylcitrate dehydratase PrpD